MKHTLVVITAFILGGCAAGTAQLSGAGSSTTQSSKIDDGPATLLGRDGETASHLYSRLLARACAANETEHVVAQVEDFLDACKDDGQRECELAACDRLREAMPRRCTDRIALR